MTHSFPRRLLLASLLAWLAVLLLLLLAPLPGAQAATLLSPLDTCPPNTSCVPPSPSPSPPPICSILPNDPKCSPGGGGGGGGSCTAPGGGSPSCGGAGPGSVGGGGSAGVMVGGGNPINLLSGNKYQEETDLAALPGVLGLEFKRYYNSLGSYPGLAGANWRTSYETVLYDLGSQVQIVQADGRRITLQRGTGGSAQLCTSPQLQDGQVRIEQQGEQRVYRWRWADGRTLTFRAVGTASGGYPLHEIRAASGEQVQLRYSPLGDLTGVTDPQGRKLEFVYGRATAGQRAPLLAVLTPLGRVSYQHDAQGRLTAVSQHALGKDGQPLAAARVTRLYHHEAEHNAGYGFLLTGISVQAPGENNGQPQRLSTYAYDAEGRAVLSTKGLPAQAGKADAAHGIEQVRVEYLAKPSPNEGVADKSGEVQVPSQKLGRLRLTNSLGQVSELKTAVIGGQLRLVEFTGAGCATCGPANMRYGYDASGRLVRSIALDARGQPLRAELQRYDARGRLIEVAQQAYASGKVQPAQWRQRLDYTDVRFADGSVALGTQPTRMEQPSVVAGQVRAVDVAYNDHAQVLRVTERGWSPIDALGNAQPTPLERSTAYRYASVAGRSVLAEIDGPLANGPKNAPDDSDVTKLEWDAQGLKLTAVVQPGNRRNVLAYDPASGRVASVRNDAGLLTQFTYNANGELNVLRTQGPGWPKASVQTIQYDAQGRPVEWGRGEVDGADYRGEQRVAYDVADRMVWRASASGQLDQFGFDTEGRLIRRMQRMGRIEQIEQQAFDAQGRLVQIRTNTGPRLHIDYDARGRIAAATDALGRTHVPQVHRGEPAVQQTLDDWGRLVRTRSPDAGQTLRDYDAADRLTGAVDALGQRANYSYDPQGRIAEQRIEGLGKPPLVTRWRYEGRHLVALEHPTQSERYTYDPRGCRVASTVSRPTSTGPATTAVTRTTYDEQGQPVAQRLADGSWLRWQRDGLGQVTAIKRDRLHTPWLRWLLPTQTLASDIQRDLVGLRHVTSGNGLANDWLRSREGLLARLTVNNPRAVVTAQEAGRRYGRLMDMLGVANAHAMPDAAPAPAASASAAPGPARDLHALREHRYLWDVQGNLLLDADPAAQAQAAYAYDARDRLVIEAARSASGPRHSRWLFDAQGRRLLQQQGQSDPDELARGTERPAYARGTHRWLGTPSQADGARYDARGLPLQLNGRRFEWDALGRMVLVTLADGTQARYTYDHRGRRIAKQVGQQHASYLYDDESRLVAQMDGAGRIVQQIVYAGDLPLAVIDTPGGGAMPGVEPGLGDDLRRLWHAWFGPRETLSWLHVNHLNEVELATDANGNAVWQAEHDAHGLLIRASGNLSFALRLPGQFFDAETGLHYNGQRYYDPERGEYLTPDPLGTPDGPNPFSYVRDNPLRYVDPDGLLLFAFDGTGNTDDTTDLAALGNGLSNVVKFRDLYDSGTYKYITGVGTRHHDPVYGDIYYNWGNTSTLDMGLNMTGPKRIERMVQYFNDEADAEKDDEKVLDIDVLGFSRGAAQARDFANRVVANTKNGYYQYKVTVNGKDETHCQKVNFRFMGLFDTVLSTNKSGTSYQLGIPDAFAHVSQAVALNEYRGKTFRQLSGSTGAFPLESIMDDAASPILPAGKTRTEMGFLGSHADIGGGFAVDAQLSRVALSWMVEQAKQAGITMKPITGDDATVPSKVVLHDKSDNQFCTTGPGCSEDREVHYQKGSQVKQRDMAFSAGLDYKTIEQEKFISYYPTQLDPNGNPIRVPKADFTTGTVDMNKYVQWLKGNGYDLGGLSVQ